MEVIDKIEENSSSHIFIAMIIGFLAGIAVGFIVAPIKKGIAIGSYNGCNNKITDSNKTGSNNSIVDSNDATIEHCN